MSIDNDAVRAVAERILDHGCEQEGFMCFYCGEQIDVDHPTIEHAPGCMFVELSKALGRSA